MASKARRSANWVHALGAFGRGAERGLERKQRLEEIVAQRAIQDQQDRFKREMDLIQAEMTLEGKKAGSAYVTPQGIIRSEPIAPATADALAQRLQSLRAGLYPPIPGAQAQQTTPPPVPAASSDLVPRPSNPNVTTIPGTGRITVQQGDVTISKSEFLKNPDKYKNTPNLKVVDDMEAGPTSKPESALAALDALEGLLKQIPTSLSTAVTAGNSKVLGGEREIAGIKMGSDAIKAYEDSKPGTAVTLYRSITGDTRLSDADAAQRALPFLPSVFPVVDTDAVRAWKVQRAREGLNLARQMKAQSPAAPLDFESVMAQASQSLKARGIVRPVDPQRISELLTKKNLTKDEITELMEYDQAMGGGR